MRTHLIALAFALAACSPAAPPQQSSASGETAASAPVNPDTAALGGAPQAGQWFERVDEGTFAAGFGVPESEYQFVIICTQGSGAITLTTSNELAPDQATTIRIITPVQTLELAARSFNEGLPSISAEIADDAPEKIPLIGMLGAPADRFAIDAAGEIAVYPWNDAIARTLTACR